MKGVVLVALLSVSSTAMAGKDPCSKVKAKSETDAFTGEETVTVPIAGSELRLRGEDLSLKLLITLNGVSSEPLPAGFTFKWLLEDGTVVDFVVPDPTPPTGEVGAYAAYTKYVAQPEVTPELVRQVAASPPVKARFEALGNEYDTDLNKRSQKYLQRAFACVAGAM